MGYYLLKAHFSHSVRCINPSRHENLLVISQYRLDSSVWRFAASNAPERCTLDNRHGKNLGSIDIVYIYIIYIYTSIPKLYYSASYLCMSMDNSANSTVSTAKTHEGQLFELRWTMPWHWLKTTMFRQVSMEKPVEPSGKVRPAQITPINHDLVGIHHSDSGSIPTQTGDTWGSENGVYLHF